MLNKRLSWFFGLLCALAISTAEYRTFSSRSRILVDVSSPTLAWRVVVRGTEVMGGIEVTADVYTRDGGVFSCGVLDLRPEWPETEYVYQADATFHTRIDEVKAVVGDKLLFRDDYFSENDFAVSGSIAGQDVKYRIGNVDNLGFHFMSGLSLEDGEKVSVQFVDFPAKLTPGKVIDIASSDLPSFNPSITYYHKISDPNSSDPDSSGQDRLRVLSHDKPFSLRLEVDQVTGFVVTGTMRLTGCEPDVDLSGSFRLVNRLSDTR